MMRLRKEAFMDANSLTYQRNGVWELTDEHFFNEGCSVSFDAYVEILCTGHFEVNARSTDRDWDGTFDTFREAKAFVDGLYVAWLLLCRESHEVAA
jgi:hypothetical protein